MSSSSATTSHFSNDNTRTGSHIGSVVDFKSSIISKKSNGHNIAGETKSPDSGNNDDSVVLTIQRELFNMGKALQCPLCLSTLCQPVVLPCLHAFCEQCIARAISFQRNNTSCPVCKTPCSKRSMIKDASLSQAARGYKYVERAFGFAPIIYDGNVDMTQIEEEEVSSMTADDERKGKCKHTIARLRRGGTHLSISMVKIKEEKPKDCTSNHSNNIKPTPPLIQCHEHFSVVKTVRNELQKSEKHDYLLGMQQQVVKSGEQLLVKAAVNKSKRLSLSKEGFGNNDKSDTRQNRCNDDQNKVSLSTMNMKKPTMMNNNEIDKYMNKPKEKVSKKGERNKNEVDITRDRYSNEQKKASTRNKRKSTRINSGSQVDSVNHQDEKMPKRRKRETSLVNEKRRTKQHQEENEGEIISNVEKYDSCNLVELALERYQSILNFEETSRQKKNSIYIVTSGLSEEEKEVLSKFCNEARRKGSVTVMKDFNPKKTTICITSSDKGSISKMRTVKAMRASLAGCPIVSPKWLRYCLDGKCISLPQNSMFIHTLPAKIGVYNVKPQSSRPPQSAHMGVMRIAAQHQICKNEGKRRLPPLLHDVTVMLCGNWKSNSGRTSDVQLLLREAGATMCTSVSQALQKLAEIKKSCAIEAGFVDSLVFLCDDSVGNNFIQRNLASSIRDFLQQFEGKDDVKRHLPVIVVNLMWLFDSISCATVLDADHFEPTNPNAKSLWQLCLVRKKHG